MPAGALEPQALAWGVEQVLRLAEDYDEPSGRLDGPHRSPSSSCLRVRLLLRHRPHLAGPLGVRPLAAARVLALQPARCGAASARAFPVQGAAVLVLIGGGIAGDLIGEGEPGYDIAMSIGVVGLLGLFLLAFPITFFNRPRFLVPPHQRDEPGAIEEWRRARGAAARLALAHADPPVGEHVHRRAFRSRRPPAAARARPH